MKTQCHLYVKGDVIGVGFRAWVKIQAKMLKVDGWVKNVYDSPEIFGPGGGVEVVVQAKDDLTNKMVELIKSGPPVSHVTGVDIYWQNVSEIFEGFEIRK